VIKLPGARGQGVEDPLAGGLLSRVRAILVLGGVPAGDLDDSVQQVRLKLLEQYAGPDRDEIRDPAAWVAVVASRVAVDWHRSLRRRDDLRTRLLSRWEHLARPADDDKLLALVVAGAMQQLPRSQRQVLALRFYADMSIPQMATSLGIPEGTVKSRLHSAVNAIRDELRRAEVS
jgi:RNA polymerase sigma-70 factor (ECF subfamily)